MQFSSGGVFSDLSNDANYSGVTTDELTVTDNAAGFDGYRYRVRVSGTCNPPVNSAEAMLNVNENPQITVDPSGSEMCEGGITSFISGASGPSR